MKEFLHAVQRGDAAAVAALLASEPELARTAFDYDKTGLHWAAEKDALDVARVLLDAGADIEAKTSWGATPLDWAAVMGSGRVAHLLLERGASGFTLLVAAALGKLRDVQSMVDSGADLASPRSMRSRGMPDREWPADTARMQGDVLSEALHAAARNGHVPVVEYLLGRGAKVDAKGFFGATGLHWAAINGHAAMVELLIARGANLDLKDARFESTTESWAEEGKHSHIANRLRQSRRKDQ